ncbi:hypothetical protein B0H14DRAFT_3451846 [Mycena olivaceomarginata]|nr:hypothetical protein B0H14DRAFT_3451846 [Mycena olivaceomarginata]
MDAAKEVQPGETLVITVERVASNGARNPISQHQDKSPLKLPDSKKRKRISDSADEPAQKLQRTDAPPLAATIPIDKEHANQILHVLQVIDEQGLLDRVYPLEQSSTTYSLRTLLSNAQEYTLDTLRTAVQNLRPISLHPRTPPAAPAAQQQRFCDLALSLLDQASFHPVSVEVESLLPQETDDPAPKFVSASSDKRYALMQHLPGGDYWSSANLPHPSASESGPADLKDAPTGHADLVALFPTPSTSSPSTIRKLGDYARAPVYGAPKNTPLPAQRRVTCGAFLDYGLHASFAPTWVQNGREVGMRELSEVVAQRAQRYREKLAARQRAVEVQQAAIAAAKAAEEEVMLEDVQEKPEPTEVRGSQSDVDGLQDILAPDEIESLKAVLGSLELENAVQELLTRNRKALQRLGQLQVERLRIGTDADSNAWHRRHASTLKEGDEEWDIRSFPTGTNPESETPTWQGTLPPPIPTRPATALRDNTTVKVRPGVAAVPPPPPVPAPVPVAGTPSYAYGQPQYYTQQGQGQGTPRPVQGYYAPAANQVPYGYGGAAGWYGAAAAYGQGQQAYQAQQFQTPTQGYGAAAYGSGASTPVGKAVANTVLGKSALGQGAGQGQWAYGTQTPPVLPAHLRAGGGSFATPS